MKERVHYHRVRVEGGPLQGDSIFQPFESLRLYSMSKDEFVSKLRELPSSGHLIKGNYFVVPEGALKNREYPLHESTFVGRYELHPSDDPASDHVLQWIPAD